MDFFNVLCSLKYGRPYDGHVAPNGSCREKNECLDHLPGNASVPFLQIYNCDSAPIPHPSWADRAKKQIYR